MSQEKEENNNNNENKRPTIFDCHVMYILQYIGSRGSFRTPILYKTTDIQHNFSEEAIQSAIEQVTYELDKAIDAIHSN